MNAAPISLLLAAALLAGCGDDAPPADGDTPTTAGSESAGALPAALPTGDPLPVGTASPSSGDGAGATAAGPTGAAGAPPPPPPPPATTGPAGTTTPPAGGPAATGTGGTGTTSTGTTSSPTTSSTGGLLPTLPPVPALPPPLPVPGLGL